MQSREPSLLNHLVNPNDKTISSNPSMQVNTTQQGIQQSHNPQQSHLAQDHLNSTIQNGYNPMCMPSSNGNTLPHPVSSQQPGQNTFQNTILPALPHHVPNMNQAQGNYHIQPLGMNSGHALPSQITNFHQNTLGTSPRPFLSQSNVSVTALGSSPNSLLPSMNRPNQHIHPSSNTLGAFTAGFSGPFAPLQVNTSSAPPLSLALAQQQQRQQQQPQSTTLPLSQQQQSGLLRPSVLGNHSHMGPISLPLPSSSLSSKQSIPLQQLPCVVSSPATIAQKSPLGNTNIHVSMPPPSGHLGPTHRPAGLPPTVTAINNINGTSSSSSSSSSSSLLLLHPITPLSSPSAADKVSLDQHPLKSRHITPSVPSNIPSSSNSAAPTPPPSTTTTTTTTASTAKHHGKSPAPRQTKTQQQAEFLHNLTTIKATKHTTDFNVDSFLDSQHKLQEQMESEIQHQQQLKQQQQHTGSSSLSTINTKNSTVMDHHHHNDGTTIHVMDTSKMRSSAVPPSASTSESILEPISSSTSVPQSTIVPQGCENGKSSSSSSSSLLNNSTTNGIASSAGDTDTTGAAPQDITIAIEKQAISLSQAHEEDLARELIFKQLEYEESKKPKYNISQYNLLKKYNSKTKQLFSRKKVPSKDKGGKLAPNQTQPSSSSSQQQQLHHNINDNHSNNDQYSSADDHDHGHEHDHSHDEHHHHNHMFNNSYLQQQQQHQQAGCRASTGNIAINTIHGNIMMGHNTTDIKHEHYGYDHGNNTHHIYHTDMVYNKNKHDNISLDHSNTVSITTNNGSIGSAGLVILPKVEVCSDGSSTSVTSTIDNNNTMIFPSMGQLQSLKAPLTTSSRPVPELSESISSYHDGITTQYNNASMTHPSRATSPSLPSSSSSSSSQPSQHSSTSSMHQPESNVPYMSSSSASNSTSSVPSSSSSSNVPSSSSSTSTSTSSVLSSTITTKRDRAPSSNGNDDHPIDADGHYTTTNNTTDDHDEPPVVKRSRTSTDNNNDSDTLVSIGNTSSSSSSIKDEPSYHSDKSNNITPSTCATITTTITAPPLPSQPPLQPQLVLPIPESSIASSSLGPVSPAKSPVNKDIPSSEVNTIASSSAVDVSASTTTASSMSPAAHPLSPAVTTNPVPVVSPNGTTTGPSGLVALPYIPHLDMQQQQQHTQQLQQHNYIQPSEPTTPSEAVPSTHHASPLPTTATTTTTTTTTATTSSGNNPSSSSLSSSLQLPQQHIAVPSHDTSSFSHQPSMQGMSQQTFNNNNNHGDNQHLSADAMMQQQQQLSASLSLSQTQPMMGIGGMLSPQQQQQQFQQQQNNINQLLQQQQQLNMKNNGNNNGAFMNNMMGQQQQLQGGGSSNNMNNNNAMMKQQQQQQLDQQQLLLQQQQHFQQLQALQQQQQQQHIPLSLNPTNPYMSSHQSHDMTQLISQQQQQQHVMHLNRPVMNNGTGMIQQNNNNNNQNLLLHMNQNDNDALDDALMHVFPHESVKIYFELQGKLWPHLDTHPLCPPISNSLPCPNVSMLRQMLSNYLATYHPYSLEQFIDPHSGIDQEVMPSSLPSNNNNTSIDRGFPSLQTLISNGGILSGGIRPLSSAEFLYVHRITMEEFDLKYINDKRANYIRRSNMYNPHGLTDEFCTKILAITNIEQQVEQVRTALIKRWTNNWKQNSKHKKWATMRTLDNNTTLPIKTILRNEERESVTQSVDYSKHDQYGYYSGGVRPLDDYEFIFTHGVSKQVFFFKYLTNRARNYLARISSDNPHGFTEQFLANLPPGDQHIPFRVDSIRKALKARWENWRCTVVRRNWTARRLHCATYPLPPGVLAQIQESIDAHSSNIFLNDKQFQSLQATMNGSQWQTLMFNPTSLQPHLQPHGYGGVVMLNAMSNTVTHTAASNKKNNNNNNNHNNNNNINTNNMIMNNNNNNMMPSQTQNGNIYSQQQQQQNNMNNNMNMNMNMIMNNSNNIQNMNNSNINTTTMLQQQQQLQQLQQMQQQQQFNPMNSNNNNNTMNTMRSGSFHSQSSNNPILSQNSLHTTSSNINNINNSNPMLAQQQQLQQQIQHQHHILNQQGIINNTNGTNNMIFGNNFDQFSPLSSGIMQGNIMNTGNNNNITTNGGNGNGTGAMLSLATPHIGMMPSPHHSLGMQSPQHGMGQGNNNTNNITNNNGGNGTGTMQSPQHSMQSPQHGMGGGMQSPQHNMGGMASPMHLHGGNNNNDGADSIIPYHNTNDNANNNIIQQQQQQFQQQHGLSLPPHNNMNPVNNMMMMNNNNNLLNMMNGNIMSGGIVPGLGGLMSANSSFMTGPNSSNNNMMMMMGNNNNNNNNGNFIPGVNNHALNQLQLQQQQQINSQYGGNKQMNSQMMMNGNNNNNNNNGQMLSFQSQLKLPQQQPQQQQQQQQQQSSSSSVSSLPLMAASSSGNNGSVSNNSGLQTMPILPLGQQQQQSMNRSGTNTLNPLPVTSHSFIHGQNGNNNMISSSSQLFSNNTLSIPKASTPPPQQQQQQSQQGNSMMMMSNNNNMMINRQQSANANSIGNLTPQHGNTIPMMNNMMMPPPPPQQQMLSSIPHPLNHTVSPQIPNNIGGRPNTPHH